jgi:hypothetical protein
MMPLINATPAFEQRYASHLKHLKLQGLQPKTLDAYARAIRCMGEHFSWQIDTLSADGSVAITAKRRDKAAWPPVLKMPNCRTARLWIELGLRGQTSSGLCESCAWSQCRR